MARKQSQYLGVVWNAHAGRWAAQIVIPPTRGFTHLGFYGSEEDAARAYDAAARRFVGAQAKVNFGEDSHD